MRTSRDESGKLCFGPEEWRTAKQSFPATCSNATSTKKHLEKYFLKNPKPSVRKTFKHKKQKDSCRNCRQWVYQAVNMRHPVQYNGHDICGLAKRGTAEIKI